MPSAKPYGHFHRPDDPVIYGVCPTCGCRCRRDPNDVAQKLLKVNAGRVPKTVIASALNWSIGKLERFARQRQINLECHEREHEPRGA